MSAARSDIARPARIAGEQAEATPSTAGRVAAPRRVLRLDTSVYAPVAPKIPRPGAMDFTRIPSLLLGHRTRYWGTSQ